MTDPRKLAEELYDTVHGSFAAYERVIDAIVAIIQSAQRDAWNEAIEAAVAIALAQEYYPDTQTGMRQQWVKAQIAEKIRALKLEAKP